MKICKKCGETDQELMYSQRVHGIKIIYNVCKECRKKLGNFKKGHITSGLKEVLA